MFPQPMRLKSNWQKKKHTQKHFINDGISLSLYLFELEFSSFSDNMHSTGTAG